MADLLVVDDEPDMAFLIRALTRRDGHTVRSAPDVATSWELLLELQPDLALVDVNLLGESGLVLCRRVRGHSELAGLPLALLSRLTLPGDVAAGWEVGVDFLFNKDLLAQPDRARARLAEILAGARGRPLDSLLTCSTLGVSSPEPTVWVPLLNAILRHPHLRFLDRRVLRALVLRALAQGGDSSWLAEEEASLAVDRVPVCSTDRVLALLDELAGQFWRLLGGEESASIRVLLARLGASEKLQIAD